MSVKCNTIQMSLEVALELDNRRQMCMEQSDVNAGVLLQWF